MVVGGLVVGRTVKLVVVGETGMRKGGWEEEGGGKVCGDFFFGGFFLLLELWDGKR